MGCGLNLSIPRLHRLVCLGLVMAAVSQMGLSVAGCKASTMAALNLDFLGHGGGSAGLAARVDDPDNVGWNASALAFGRSDRAFAGFMDYLVGVRGGTAGYMGRPSPRGGYGVWVSYLSSGSLTQTAFDDPTGQAGGTFKHSELVVGLSAGKALLPYLAVGTGLKLARQDLDDFSASGLFGDLSITFRLYSPDPERSSHPRIYTSYIARNLVLARWEEEEGETPGNSEIALALEFPRSGVATGMSFYFGSRGRREVRLGLEAGLSDQFQVRVGYRRRTGLMSDEAHDLPWERGLIAGFGLGFGRLWIDYTYEDASPLDNIHRFAIRSALSREEQN